MVPSSVLRALPEVELLVPSKVAMFEELELSVPCTMEISELAVLSLLDPLVLPALSWLR